LKVRLLGHEVGRCGKTNPGMKRDCRIMQRYCSIWRKPILMHWCRAFYCVTKEPSTV